MRRFRFVCLWFIVLFNLIVPNDGGCAENKVVWKLAMTWGENLPPFTDAVRQMSETVNRLSQGTFIIDIESSAIHNKPFGVLDMVQSGKYHMAHSASYYWKNKDFVFLPFTTMPFGMTSNEQYAWFYYGGGMSLMQKAYAQLNLLSFPGGNTGAQMGGWFAKEIRTVDDLKDLKMRIPGFAGEVLSRLGVKVTNLPVEQLYSALEDGTIDALEWVGPGMDISMGFHKLVPYYYTGWHEPATELQFLVNKTAYNALSEIHRHILTTAMKLAAYDMYIHNYYLSSEAWAKIKKDYPNIKVRTFSRDLLEVMRAANEELLSEKIQKNPQLKEVLDSQKKFMKKARNWTRISDFAYLQNNI